MTTATLPDIVDVRPVDETDRACLLEVRAVLERHGALKRFGINLLHDHFPMDDDEVLLEVCDPEERTLTIRPGTASSLEEGRFVGTNFQFDGEPPAADEPLAAKLVCKVGCFVDLKDRHSRTHDRVWG